MPPANKIDKTKRTPPRKKASAKKHRRRKRPVPYRIAFLRWHDPDQVQGSGAGPSRLRRAPLEFYPYSVCFCRENDSTNPRGCQCRARGAGRAAKRNPRVLAISVGADSISARFAAARTPAGGINPSPTNHGKRPTKRDGHNPPGGRRAGCPHPAGPRHAANTCGRIWNPPLQWVPRIGNMRCFRLARNTQNDCRAGCPHPAGPAARRPVFRPPRCALPVSPPISSPACHLSRRAV